MWYKRIIIAVVCLLIPLSYISALPTTRYEQNINPFLDSTYELGTSTNAWLRGTFDIVCLTADTCRTAWPSGGGGGTSTPGSVLFASSTGEATGDNPSFFYDSILKYLGVGTNVPVAPGHFVSSVSLTTFAPTSGNISATVRTLPSTPTISNVTATAITGVGAAPTPGASEIDVGSGNFTASLQSINYTLYAYRTINGTRYYSLAQIGTFNEATGDAHTFNLDVTWAPVTNADGYIIVSDATAAYDVGNVTNVVDLNGSFSVGSPSSTPTANFFIASAGGTRNYRSTGYKTTESGSAVYSAAYNYAVTEPAAGNNYLIRHSILSLPSNATQVWVYGADDGSTGFTNSINATGVSDYYETSGGWGEATGFTGTDVQTPTDYGITGSGQTLTYVIRTSSVVDGFVQLYSSNSLTKAVVVPNTGSKYYVSIDWTGATTNIPVSANTTHAYKVVKNSTNSLTTSPSNTTIASAVALLVDDGQTFTGNTTVTPSSYVAGAARFISAATGDPLGSTVNFTSQLYVQTTSANGTAAVGFYSGTGSRIGHVWATASGMNYDGAAHTYRTMGSITQGGFDTVGWFVGTGNTTARLSVLGNVASTVLIKGRLTGSQTANAIEIENSTSQDLFVVTKDGALIVNEQGADADTRFEGDTNANLFYLDASADAIGIGHAAPSALLHLIKTTEQFRVGYDTSNYYSTTIGSTGGVTLDSVGSGAGFTFNDNITMADTKNFVFNSTTGTKFGTAISQKIGFYNATPVVQAGGTIDLGVVLSNLGLRAAGTAYPITTTGAVDVGAFRADSITNDTGLAHGTYTPTRSAEANLDANATMTEAQYMRVGNTVTVSGRFTADPTLPATATSFEITLPVASNIGATEDAAGTAFSGTIAGQGGAVIGSVANNTAVIQWLSGDTTSQSWSYTFTYQVI